MKKQTKLFTTLSAAALLTIGVSAVSMAAGWDNSTGEWRYLNSDGTEVTDAWKSANGNWFYLGSDGVMVTNQLIEDTNNTTTRYYYVDQYGAMVKNTWKAVALDDSSSSLDAEYYWYYFDSDGKAYTSKDELGQNEIKTINGLKYAFDSEGHMLYGWINPDNVEQQDGDDSAWETSQYFFNGWNDGHMQTGWAQLTVEDDNETKEYWFYFGNDGKKVGYKDGKRKKINGSFYHFAADGHMITGWGTATQSVKDANATSGQLNYLNGDGSERKNKWVWAVPDEDSVEDDLKKDYNDDEYSWWYFNNSGSLVVNQIKKINGKEYAFDKYGRMLKGFVCNYDSDNNGKVDSIEDAGNPGDWKREEIIAGATDDGKYAVDGDFYFFSNDKEKDGSKKKGYQTLELDDGSYQFYFNTSNGKAYTDYVSKIRKYVKNGLVLQPSNDDDRNYAGIVVTTGDKPVDMVFGSDAVGNILVNKSGNVVKKKAKIKDSDDSYYIADAAGRVVAFFETEDEYNNYVGYKVEGSDTLKCLNIKADWLTKGITKDQLKTKINTEIGKIKKATPVEA